ncbi:MAG: DUF2442 domain-containing protein [Bacteroidetes bacterium]|nr:DUF2442 domain-containing protein [Bacteroidota bacterium]
MLHKITSIHKIIPYKILVTFDGVELREIDFENVVKDFTVLQNLEIFMNATLDDYPTIKWDNLAKMKNLDGKIIDAPLDFCPDSLYLISSSV